jgi:hypothetical protein
VKKKTTLKKPTLPTDTVLEFAERPSEARTGDKSGKQGLGKGKAEKTSPTKPPQVSGNVPPGDVRLSANISEELHLKLKIAAARRRTTIGELIEEMIEELLD